MTALERIGQHIHRLHIKDTHAFHPGGTNIYFVGDPATEMTLVDTGEQDREWTRLILDAYRDLGEPKIAAILITHGHVDHIGGLDRIHEVMRAPVRCHPKLVEKLTPYLGAEWVTKLRSRERIAAGGGAVLEARFTPGHAEDHACYFLNAEKIALTGQFKKHVLPLIADGRIRAVVDRSFSLDQAAEAHEYMESNANFGKIILTIE